MLCVMTFNIRTKTIDARTWLFFKTKIGAIHSLNHGNRRRYGEKSKEYLGQRNMNLIYKPMITKSMKGIKTLLESCYIILSVLSATSLATKPRIAGAI